ncbi:MAG TPA: hemerythrin domain-containing protein [Pyrinomonadaceae bacterium]|nr:hemerythrin domain-containing protein [Pyrinomonadaceae bacterium]
MNSSIEALLGDDHESLAQLLVELNTQLTRSNSVRAFELLDLFWARLAVHIRAENLHLFPALANTPAARFTGKGGLPTAEEAHNTLLSLRSDHDFFMKELAQMMKVARAKDGRDEVKALKKRLAVIKKRLEVHNDLEEKQVYHWPSLLLDEKSATALSKRLRHELENLPPRFA